MRILAYPSWSRFGGSAGSLGDDPTAPARPEAPPPGGRPISIPLPGVGYSATMQTEAVGAQPPCSVVTVPQIPVQASDTCPPGASCGAGPSVTCPTAPKGINWKLVGSSCVRDATAEETAACKAAAAQVRTPVEDRWVATGPFDKATTWVKDHRSASIGIGIAALALTGVGVYFLIKKS